MPIPHVTPHSLAHRALITLALLLPPALPARAQLQEPDSSADEAGEAAYLADLPVVLSATRLQQARADTPGSVMVIDRHMIHASGARNVHELFMLVPGFQVGLHTGNQPLITYHGLSDEAPRRMLVQVDGRSVYSPYFIAGVEWNHLGVDIDERLLLLPRDFCAARNNGMLDDEVGTALCPRCSIDSVIGSESGYPFMDAAFLQAMHERWFSANR